MGASGLGALLVKEGFLTEQDRVTITKTCGQGSWAFAKCILSTGLLDEDELSAFFAERTKYVVAPKNLLDRLDTGIVEQVDRRMVSRLEVLPLEIDHHRITVAVADPLDKSTLKQLEFFTGLEVVPVIAPLSQIHEGLSRLNPEFKPRPTALSNFLRNHAGAAWIKQKIVEEGDIDIPQEHAVRGGALDHYADEQAEDQELDDEIDAMEDDTSDLNDIDAGGLDEGIGNSDFDDIDLEDGGSDLELAPGDDPDHDLDAAAPIDDAGLDIDDPFDNFDDAPKASKPVATPVDDDLEGLETGGDSIGDLWPDTDDAPAKPAAAAAAKPQASMPEAEDDLSVGGELPDDFGFDDEEAPTAKPKNAAKAELSDDLGLDEASPSEADAADDDAFGLSNTANEAEDINLEDDFSSDASPKTAEAIDDDLLGETPDLSLDEDEAPAAALSADDLLEDMNAADDDPGIDHLLDEPAPAADTFGEDLPDFSEKPRAPVESTRMAPKPALLATQDRDEDDDLSGIEFADDDETSVSLRKAVHEDGVLPEFTDPNSDHEEEDTRIDLHAAVEDDLEFGEGEAEETSINLHAIDEDLKDDAGPDLDEGDGAGLEDLSMGFNDDGAIDEPAWAGPAEPGIDDLSADAELDDIPIADDPSPAPVRAGARTAASPLDNGSAASLTATAKANEALLRMSLCFDRETALDIAREYLPQISATGCLVDIGKTTEALATWRRGAQAAAPGKTNAFQRLAKEAKAGQWSEVQVPAKDELFDSVRTLSVYKIQKGDGRVLLLAGDYPLDDDSLREALTSFAEQLGAK